MKKTTLIALCFLAPLTGCVVETNFDPIGNELSVEGSWTVNGFAATEQTCAEAGIDSVEVVFFSGGLEFSYPDEFRYDCARGFFDTRNEVGLVLDRGRYTTQWRAYDFNNEIVGEGAELELETTFLPLGSHVILAESDFGTLDTAFNPRGTAGSVRADWTVNDQVPTQDLCDQANIADVRIVLYDQADAARTAGITLASAPCADGTYTSSGTVLAEGTYLWSLRAFDSDGQELLFFDGAEPISISSAQIDYLLGPVNFTATVVTTALTLTLQWDTTQGEGEAFANCATAGMNNFGYTLTNTTDDTVADMTEGLPLLCGEDSNGDTLTFENLVAGNTYAISVSGDSLPVQDGGSGQKWEGTCENITVTAGENTAICQVVQ